MPITRIDGLGDIGAFYDVPNFAIPDNALSLVQNVRPKDGRLRAFPRENAIRTSYADARQLFAEFAGPLFPESVTVLLCGKDYVWTIESNPANDRNITGAAVAPGLFDKWSIATQGALYGINAGIDSGSGGPQIWQSSGANIMQDMMFDRAGSSTWRALNYRTAVIRSYRGAYLALDFRGPAETANPKGTRVAWSDFMGPNDIQTDWVPRTTNNAGIAYLTTTPGRIIDGRTLRDDFIIYKSDAQVTMSFTESSAVFRFRSLQNYQPPIASECVASFEGGHVIASQYDIAFFDGNAFVSLLSRKMRDYWRDAHSPFSLYLQKTYVTHNVRDNEIWACRPRNTNYGGDDQTIDEAVVYNYRDDTITLRQLTGQTAIVFGGLQRSGTNEVDLYLMGLTQDNVDSMAFIYSAGNATKAERKGLILTDPKSGLRSVEHTFRLKKVRPYICTAPPGQTVQITIGAAMNTDEAYTEEATQTFNPQNQTEIDVRATGHFFMWRVEATSVDWEMTAIEFVYDIQKGN